MIESNLLYFKHRGVAKGTYRVLSVTCTLVEVIRVKRAAGVKWTPKAKRSFFVPRSRFVGALSIYMKIDE